MSNCNPGFPNRPPVVPAPTAPWSRPVNNPLIQELFDGAVPLALLPEVTYLKATQSGGSPISNALVLPPGNFPQQFKRIYIPGGIIAQTATWVITGTFAGGFTTLTFNAIGTSAILEWDGTAWQLAGGNAALSP